MAGSARAWTARALGLISRGEGPSWVERGLLALVALNLVVFVVETVPGVTEAHATALERFELGSMIVFAIEYLARLWACVERPEYVAPLRGRLRWMISPLALLDLIALVPYLLPWIEVDLRFSRTFRLFRLLRSLKLVRYSESLRTLVTVLGNKREELMVTVSFALTILLFAASSLYFIERDAQPEAFSSIPAAMWWAVTTLTTVGYGDVYPVTSLGRTVGAAIAMIGVGLFALPAGLLAAGFTEHLDAKRRHEGACPHCGRKGEAEATSRP